MGLGQGVQLGSAYGKIVIDGAGALGTINQVRGGLLGLGGGFSVAGAGTVALGVGLTGVGLAAGGMAAAIGSGVRVASDLEAQLSGVQAVMGASNEEIAGLKELVTDLGIDPKLKVSSLEAAAAIEMLGRNGLSVEEIMEGAARGTILLSNATGGDFSQSADIATDVMALFNIEAAQMGEAVNGITSVVNNSKFSMGDYALALAQGGGVAAATGVEFNDFNTAIAGMAQYFSSGSDAGTSFKVMLQRLVPASNPAKAAMAELGIITEDGSNKFFDANGNLKEMADVAGILQNALGNLSEEKRNDALATIFGTDAMRAAVGLADLGADGFRDLQGAMAETDAAENAATRMGNLAGALEILQGIIETIRIRIGDAFIPLIRSLTEQTSAFMEAHGDELVGFFENVAGAIEQTLPYVFDFVAGILAWGEKIPGVVDQVGGLWAQITAIFNEGGIAGLVEAFWSWVTGGQGIVATAGGKINEAVAAISQWLIDQWPVILETLNVWADNFWDWLTGENGALTRTSETMTRLSEEMVAWAQSDETQAQMAELGNSLADGLIAVLENLRNDQPRIQAVALSLTILLVQVTLAILKTVAELGGQLAAGLIGGLVEGVLGEEATESVQNAVIAMFRNGLGGMKQSLAEDAAQIGVEIVAGIISGINSMIEDLKSSVQGMINAIPGTARSLLGIQSPSTVFAGIGENISLGLAAGIKGAATVPQAEVAALVSRPETTGAVAGVGGQSITHTASLAVGDIIIQGADDPAATARLVRQELERLLNLARRGAYAYG